MAAIHEVAKSSDKNNLRMLGMLRFVCNYRHNGIMPLLPTTMIASSFNQEDSTIKETVEQQSVAGTVDI